MAEREAGIAIAAALHELADRVDGHTFSDGARKGIVDAAFRVVHAVGERPVCGYCTDGWVVEDEASNKVKDCPDCFGTGRELDPDVRAVIDARDDEIRRLRGDVECAGQQHIGEVAG